MQVHGFGGELQQKPERSSRSSRSTFETPSLGGSLGPSRPGPAGLARAGLAVSGWAARQAGHLGKGTAGQSGRGWTGYHSRAAEGHPLICAPSSRRLPRVRFDDGKGERGAALGQTAAEGAYAGPCSPADGRRPSPAAGFHVPFLASGLLPLGGPLAHARSVQRAARSPSNLGLRSRLPFSDAEVPGRYETARPCQVTSFAALSPT